MIHKLSGLLLPGSFLLVTLVAAEGRGAEHRVWLTVPGADRSPAPATLVLQPVSVAGGTERLEMRRLPVEAPGEVGVELPEGSTWRLEVEAEPYWAPSRVLVAGGSEGSETEVSLRLFDAGFLEGRLAVHRDDSPPEQLAARFEPAPGAQLEIPRSTVVCPVVDGHWRCKLPAARLDLRLRATGFVSHYRWGERIAPAASRDAGLLRLVRGASVVGWVTPPPVRGFDFADCQSEIEPALAGGSPSPVERERLEELIARAPVNERGFFELAGIAPGSYRLTVRHPDYAPARIAPVEVYENAETEVREIELRDFAHLALTVSPPTDPSGRPWTVVLLKESVVPGHLDEVVERPIGEEGQWQSDGLEVGRYRVEVHDARGNHWHWQDVDLAPGVDPLQLEVALPLVRVAGEVLLGDEPLAAWLYFGGFHGRPRIAARSDERGRFRAVLPDRERWVVDVRGIGTETSTRFGDVTVPPASSGEEGWLELVVPDTTLAGRVITEDGDPYPGAFIDLNHPEDPGPHARSRGPDGRFVVRGLREGEWRVRARAEDDRGQWSSHVVTVSVEEDPPPPEVELVLLREVRVEGQVVSPSGQPIVGAKIVGLVEQTSLSLTNSIPEASTGVDGTFELPLPAGSEMVQLTVMAPGFAVHQLRIDARTADPSVVTVEPVGGTVVLRFDGEPGAFNKVLLFRDFLVAVPMYLDHWAQANGADLHDPRRRDYPLMEPGPYTACFDLQGSDSLFTGRPPANPRGRCVQGVLSPFGELELVLPSAPGVAGR